MNVLQYIFSKRVEIVVPVFSDALSDEGLEGDEDAEEGHCDEDGLSHRHVHKRRDDSDAKRGLPRNVEVPHNLAKTPTVVQKLTDKKEKGVVVNNYPVQFLRI